MKKWRSKTNIRWKEKPQTEPSFPTHFYITAQVGFLIWNENERLAGKNNGCSGLFLSQQKPCSLLSPSRGNRCIKDVEHFPVFPLYAKLPFYFPQEHRCKTRCAGQVALHGSKFGPALTECWVAATPMNINACSEHQRHSASWKNVVFLSLDYFLLSQLETLLFL